MSAPLSRALVAALALCLFGCGGVARKPPVVERAAAPSRLINFHEVNPGETLFSIAWSYDLDFRQLAAANKIVAPYRIYARQKLVLPPPPKAPPAQRGRVLATASGNAETVTGTAASSAKMSVAEPSKSEDVSTARGQKTSIQEDWVWPANGVIVQHSQSLGPGRRVLIFEAS